MAREVESVYGNALFEAAKDEGRLNELFGESESLQEIICGNPELSRVLTHPDIKSDEKLALIDNIFAGRADGLFVETMKLAIDKGHSGHIAGILRFFSDRVMEELKIGRAEVSSAVPLSDIQREKVENKLLETTGFSKLNVNYKVDKTLIGGLVIKIGDRVVDSSVKTSLESLRKSLI